MFIKGTKTYTDKAGQARKSHRLVCNVRVDGRVRQQTLLNLGTHWDVPRELWLRIAQRTAEILAGRQALFPEPEGQVNSLSPPFAPAAFYLKSAATPQFSLPDVFKGYLSFVCTGLPALAAILICPPIIEILMPG